MSSTQEFKGKWWLPGKEENKVVGTLYFTPGKSILLELIGSLKGKSQDPFEEILNIVNVDSRIETIFGHCSNGKDITLFNSFCNISRSFKADHPITTYDSRYLVIGIHLKNINEKNFFKAVVKIPELSYWLYPDMLIKESHDGTDCECVRMRKLSKSEKLRTKVRIGSGFTFTLMPDALYEGKNFLLDVYFTQFTTLWVEKTGGASLISFYDKVVRYESFLSLATLGEVSYSELALYSKDHIKHEEGEKIIYAPIIVDSVFHPTPIDKQISIHNFLFNYDAIKSRYKDILRKWFSMDTKFDAIRGHFLEAINYQGPFSYINFLIIIQAIEGYSRRYMKEEAKSRIMANGRNRVNLRDYLETVIESQRGIRKVNQKIDLDTVIQNRDYYSHLFDEKKKKKLEVIDLYHLSSDLIRILTCCILSYLGFNNEEIDKLTWNTLNSIFHDY